MFIKLLNHIVAKVSGNVSLRGVLIVPFVLQIFAAVGLTGWLSLRNGQKAVNDVATQLRSEITAHIRSRLDAFVETPRLINQINEAAIRQRQLNPEDTKAMDRYFWQQIQFFEYMTFISYGNNRGDYVTVNRHINDRTLRLGLASLSTKNVFYSYATDSQGNRTQLLQSIPNFDPRKRPWYQTAMKAGKPVWYPIYKYASYDSLGVGIANPVYDETGSLRGVLTADVALVQISRFLHSLKIGRTGKAFIMEPDGMLMASSNLEKPFIVQGKDTKRIRASDSRDVLIQGAARYLKERFDNLSKIDSSQQLDFEIQGKRQFLQVLSYKDELGLDLLIVVVVPEADFMEQINASTHTTILLCIAALIVATVVGILTARWVTNPILRLNTAAKDIAKGEWNQTVEIERSDELGELAKSFNSMAHQLQESFETLEQRVADRTAELAIANEKLKEENLRMRAELEVTKRLQQMILPKPEELQSIDGLEIAGFMEPADEVGGDYYDVLQQNGKVKIGIGDVTGHGLESGVLMLMTQTVVRTLQESNQTDPVKFLDILNRTIYGNVQRINPDKNLTLTLLDYADGTISVSGQHEEIIVVRAGGKVERIDTINLGFPIGLDEEIADFIAQEEVQLNPGDVVVLYTDGITEAFDINQVQYGLERLCEVVSGNCDRTAQEIQQAVIEDVRQHIGKQKVFDDITLVVLKQM
jgi:sigma-B regulation protein RsbU (phosphoserine phosphatase)